MSMPVVWSTEDVRYLEKILRFDSLLESKYFSLDLPMYSGTYISDMLTASGMTPPNLLWVASGYKGKAEPRSFL